MIITKKEIEEVEKQIEDNQRHSEKDFEDYIPQTPVFFAENPHLLIPLGFDEYKAIPEDYDIESMFGIENILAFDFESVYRKRDTGEWLWFEGIDNGIFTGVNSLHFEGAARTHKYFPVDKYLETLKKIQSNPYSYSTHLWLPSNWSFGNFMEPQFKLKNSTSNILQEIIDQKKSLEEIHWRVLEEIVAELLKKQGFEVHLTPSTRDGGRDIIAKGEIINGEPLYIAVEVKQKHKVGIADVQRALKANEDFPALMIATSGRFSSGVINEKIKERNQLRLFLKDGIAIKQWLEIYKNK